MDHLSEERRRRLVCRGHDAHERAVDRCRLRAQRLTPLLEPGGVVLVDGGVGYYLPVFLDGCALNAAADDEGVIAAPYTRPRSRGRMRSSLHAWQVWWGIPYAGRSAGALLLVRPGRSASRRMGAPRPGNAAHPSNTSRGLRRTRLLRF